jgi:drug/metabolite transporter (DMT)-like permease
MFGIGFGVWLLGEPMEWRFLIGAVPVLLGIVLVNGGPWLAQWFTARMLRP